jgi:hypothetical protein
MTDFTSSSSRRKAPSLDPEDFASWEMLFKNYCGYEEWDLFYEYAPEIDEDEAAKFDKGLDELTKLLQQAMQG